jgi:hypothetical protein
MSTIAPEQVAKMPHTVHESQLKAGLPVIIRAVKPKGTNLWILERVTAIKRIKRAWWQRRKNLIVLDWRPIFSNQWYINQAAAESVARHIIAQRGDTHRLVVGKEVFYGKNAVPFFKPESKEAKMVEQAMENTVKEVFPDPERRGLNQPQ